MEKLDVKVYCSTCQLKTNHWIVKSHEEQSEPDEDFQYKCYFHIVQCMGCDTIAFVQQYGDEDTWRYRDREMEYYDEFTVYPSEPKKLDMVEQFLKDAFANRKNTSKHVPENIRNLFNQIMSSLTMGHDLLSTGGIRVIVEGICNELGVKSGYLYDFEGKQIPDEKDGVIRKHKSLGGRIYGLSDLGKITLHNAHLLQKVVKYGNGALHDMKVPTLPTLNSIVDIIEQLIYAVYEIENHSLLKENEAKKVKNN